MVHNQPIGATLARPPQALRSGTPHKSLWRRFAAWWAHEWNRTPLDAAIEAEVRKYLGHKPHEPGDVVLVNEIVEDVCRRYAW